MCGHILPYEVVDPSDKAQGAGIAKEGTVVGAVRVRARRTARGGVPTKASTSENLRNDNVVTLNQINLRRPYSPQRVSHPK